MRRLGFRKQGGPGGLTGIPPAQKLNEDIVREVKILYTQYNKTQSEICSWIKERYGIDIRQPQISHIITGRRWAKAK